MFFSCAKYSSVYITIYRILIQCSGIQIMWSGRHDSVVHHLCCRVSLKDDGTDDRDDWSIIGPSCMVLSSTDNEQDDGLWNKTMGC